MSIMFEPMEQMHSAEVMAIFNYYAENTFSAYPDTRLPDPFFAKFLEMTSGYPAYVIKNSDTDEIVGFCFLRPFNPFPVFRKTAEITYFIKHGYTGKGIGRKALDKLLDEAEKRGIRTILASISSKNEQSLAFHKKHGFRECGTFRNVGEKLGVSFDMVWMQKDLV
ncbi:MAG: N-acetyltransferase [Candidatus Auribacter fodinae]|jgi:phosphinothricin acetyltransferase|uniref:N-acetyltransferase n=1 Tax=Candidatus Auribacter fodinae TaxID=2093366 RepID=A0A3A4QV38_9BACT|nr:MAG: N-acetyltransferase [Candidatus Auribacter fodinae]